MCYRLFIGLTLCLMATIGSAISETAVGGGMREKETLVVNNVDCMITEARGVNFFVCPGKEIKIDLSDGESSMGDLLSALKRLGAVDESDARIAMTIWAKYLQNQDRYRETVDKVFPKGNIDLVVSSAKTGVYLYAMKGIRPLYYYSDLSGNEVETIGYVCFFEVDMISFSDVTFRTIQAEPICGLSADLRVLALDSPEYRELEKDSLNSIPTIK